LPIVAIHRPERDAEKVACARLIPGEGPVVQHTKKRSQSVKLSARNENVRMPSRNAVMAPNKLALLQPRPLGSPMAGRWLQALAMDWAVVTVNWLIVGALLVGLRKLFPEVWSFGYAAGTPVYLLGLAVLHAALITLIAYTEELHVGGFDLRRQGRILAKSVLWATSLLCAAYSLQGAPWTISGMLCIAGLLHFGAMWAWRSRLGECGIEAGADARKVLIIGVGTAGRQLADSISEQVHSARQVCGFLDDEQPCGNGVIGRIEDLARIARREFVDEVILAAPHTCDITRRVLSEAQRLRLDVEIVPELFGCHPVQGQIEKIGDLPLIRLHAERSPAGALFLKRALDALLAGSSLVVLFPLLITIAAFIKLDSPGPVLYCAPRAGRKGRLFRCFKFRTMLKNADCLKVNLRRNNERAGPFFKMSGDPRITRFGRWLRRYSLDELPQLWNVLRGEMSLVGPRPHPVDDVAGYDIQHLGRLDVTPGITGLWQVTARRDPSFDRGMELDREYIRTWSLGLDARILLKTLGAVVQGSGE
jgi:exopolysaccharide biosynthesis polyprenyl glycosylphosphotransferase